MRDRTLSIRGMSCGHCVATVRRQLEQVDGVYVRDVRIGSATVSYDESRVAPQRLEQVVREAGYDVTG
jgi:copper chaperone CopZ